MEHRRNWIHGKWMSRTLEDFPDKNAKCQAWEHGHSLAPLLDIDRASAIFCLKDQEFGHQTHAQNLLLMRTEVLSFGINYSVGAIHSSIPSGDNHPRTFSIPSFLSQNGYGWWCSAYVIPGWIPSHITHTHTHIQFYATPESSSSKLG